MARPTLCTIASVFAASVVLTVCAGLMTSSVTYAATPSVPDYLSESAPVAARLLESASKNLHPVVWSSSSGLPVSASGDNVDYVLSARVEGRVSSGGADMLMLKMNAVSVDALVPHDVSPTWMESGAQLRLLVRDNASSSAAGSGDGSGISKSAGFVIVAAAPESEVALLEKQLAARRAPSVTSRYGWQVRRSYAAREVTTRRPAPALPTNLPAGRPICQLSSSALAVYPYYRAEIQRINSRLDPLTLDKITSSLLYYSEQSHLDPRLMVAMILAESHFDPNAVSNHGAMGLGQLMPGTAAELGVNPYDPVQNVGGAVKILSDHVAQYGGADSSGLVPMNTLLLTMAAYNAGGGAVRKYHGVPPYRETQAYVRKVAAYYSAMCGN